MIRMYPTKPGLSKEWTVKIDFSSSGFEIEETIYPSYHEAIDGIRTWLNAEVKF